jgi:hypothetical protein
MRTIVDIPEDQVEALKRLGERSRLSRAELMRRAVAEYLQRHSPGPGDAAFGLWREQPLDALAVQDSLRAEWGE